MLLFLHIYLILRKKTFSCYPWWGQILHLSNSFGEVKAANRSGYGCTEIAIFCGAILKHIMASMFLTPSLDDEVGG